MVLLDYVWLLMQNFTFSYPVGHMRWVNGEAVGTSIFSQGGIIPPANLIKIDGLFGRLLFSFRQVNDTHDSFQIRMHVSGTSQIVHLTTLFVSIGNVMFCGSVIFSMVYIYTNYVV